MDLPVKMKRRGVELRIIIDGHEEMPPKADPALLRAVARARRWFEEIADGRVRSSAEIARREGLQKGYVARLLRLAFLSPDIVEALVAGRAPVEFNLQMMMTTQRALSLAWKEQEKLLRNLDHGKC
jgi:site-specific DNA recombinase